MVRSIRPVSAAFFIWGSVMQLKGLWGRARFRASETLSAAREKAQERLVVVAGRDSGLSFGWALGIGLGLFLAGGVVGYRYGGSEYRAFKLRQEVLEEQNARKNAELERTIEALRRQLGAQEGGQAAADEAFGKKLDSEKPQSACSEPVTKLNPTIVEAGQ